MSDPINPDHYKRGGLEAIDVILAFGLDYLLGTVAKYILRHGHKGTRPDHIDDLKKARWFLTRKIEELEAAEAASPTVVPGPDVFQPFVYPTPAPEVPTFTPTHLYRPQVIYPTQTIIKTNTGTDNEGKGG